MTLQLIFLALLATLSHSVGQEIFIRPVENSDNFTIYAYTDIKDTAIGARKFCDNLEGDLPTIHSQEDLDFLTETVQKGGPISGSGSGIFLGMYRDEEGKCNWSDRSLMDFQLVWRIPCDNEVVCNSKCCIGVLIDRMVSIQPCDIILHDQVCVIRTTRKNVRETITRITRQDYRFHDKLRSLETQLLLNYFQSTNEEFPMLDWLINVLTDYNTTDGGDGRNYSEIISQVEVLLNEMREEIIGNFSARLEESNLKVLSTLQEMVDVTNYNKELTSNMTMLLSEKFSRLQSVIEGKIEKLEESNGKVLSTLQEMVDVTNSNNELTSNMTMLSEKFSRLQSVIEDKIGNFTVNATIPEDSKERVPFFTTFEKAIFTTLGIQLLMMVGILALVVVLMRRTSPNKEHRREPNNSMRVQRVHFDNGRGRVELPYPKNMYKKNNKEKDVDCEGF